MTEFHARIAELELSLADKTREDSMQIRHIGECEGMIKELEEANREQARIIMRLVTDRNYLQAELNRIKEKP